MFFSGNRYKCLQIVLKHVDTYWLACKPIEKMGCVLKDFMFSCLTSELVLNPSFPSDWHKAGEDPRTARQRRRLLLLTPASVYHSLHHCFSLLRFVLYLSHPGLSASILYLSSLLSLWTPFFLTPSPQPEREEHYLSVILVVMESRRGIAEITLSLTSKMWMWMLFYFRWTLTLLWQWKGKWFIVTFFKHCVLFFCNTPCKWLVLTSYFRVHAPGLLHGPTDIKLIETQLNITLCGWNYFCRCLLWHFWQLKTI